MWACSSADPQTPTGWLSPAELSRSHLFWCEFGKKYKHKILLNYSQLHHEILMKHSEGEKHGIHSAISKFSAEITTDESEMGWNDFSRADKESFCSIIFYRVTWAWLFWDLTFCKENAILMIAQDNKGKVCHEWMYNCCLLPQRFQLRSWNRKQFLVKFKKYQCAVVDSRLLPHLNIYKNCCCKKNHSYFFLLQVLFSNHLESGWLPKPVSCRSVVAIKNVFLEHSNNNRKKNLLMAKLGHTFLNGEGRPFNFMTTFLKVKINHLI